jgi:ABC-type amino acid transport substrate-binding protein
MKNIIKFKLVFLILALSSTFLFSKNYAFIVGVDDYSGKWSKLDNAVNDCKSIEKILKEKYDFTDVLTLYNKQATRRNILSELKYLSTILKEEDNLLLYYAGHGFVDKANEGYWIPIETQTLETFECVSNSEIKNAVAKIKSKHTLLIVDACFSGTLFRSNTASQSENNFYKNMIKNQSRQALSSGGVQEVVDGGGDGHSVFAKYLIKKLKENNQQYLEVSEIAQYLKITVPSNTVNEQQPEFGHLNMSGHEGGSFVFVNSDYVLTVDVINQEKENNTTIKQSFRTFDKIKNSGKLIVGLSPDPPLFFFDKENNPKGFDYELANMIANELELELEIKTITFSDLPTKLKEGEVDLIMSGFIPDISFGDLYWSNEYLNADFCLIVNEGSPIKRIEDLEGLTIGTWNEPHSQKWIKENIPNAKIKTYEKTGWYKDLYEGNIDVIINEYPYAIEELKFYPRMKIVDYHVIEVGFGIGMNKEHDLLVQLNDILIEIMKSKSYEKLHKKYLYLENKKPLINKNSICIETYQIKSNENLSEIAKSELGDETRWNEIYKLNKNFLVNPFLTEKGMILCLPKK